MLVGDDASTAVKRAARRVARGVAAFVDQQGRWAADCALVRGRERISGVKDAQLEGRRGVRRDAEVEETAAVADGGCTAAEHVTPEKEFLDVLAGQRPHLVLARVVIK